MMNQPKPSQNHARILNDFAAAACKSDGTGFDVASILGRTDGSILVVGTTGEDADDGGR